MYYDLDYKMLIRNLIILSRLNKKWHAFAIPFIRLIF